MKRQGVWDVFEGVGSRRGGAEVGLELGPSQDGGFPGRGEEGREEAKEGKEVRRPGLEGVKEAFPSLGVDLGLVVGKEGREEAQEDRVEAG